MTLADPNFGYLLLLVGLWCSVFSVYKPGTGFFEVFAVGGIIGAIFVLASLATNWIGAGLVIVGVLIFLLMPLYRRFPALFALAGLALQTVGGLAMFSGVGVSPLLLGATVLSSLGLFVFVLLPILAKQQTAPAMTGDVSVIGMEGYVTKALDPVGTVNIQGEPWTASSAKPLQPGEHVIVIDKEGLRLIVRKAKVKRMPEHEDADELAESEVYSPAKTTEQGEKKE